MFAIQLAINAAWTPVFFGLHQLGAAAFVIVAVLVAVITMLVEYRRTSATAAWLIAPLAGWVAFATALNHRDLVDESLVRTRGRGRSGLRTLQHQDEREPDEDRDHREPEAIIERHHERLVTDRPDPARPRAASRRAGAA